MLLKHHVPPFAKSMNQPAHARAPLRPASSDPLAAYGFVLDEASAHRTSGHLLVTSKCCQPFGLLHGGVSALIAEDLASYGAAIASGYNRVAGIQLSINHFKSAVIGDLVLAEATPAKLGKYLQVWNVRLTKCDQSNTEIKTLISTSTVTLFCNFTVSESDKNAVQFIKEYSKL
ncbi:hypothetical protein ACS0TY_031713 [Phlomoides rotata]